MSFEAADIHLARLPTCRMGTGFDPAECEALVSRLGSERLPLLEAATNIRIDSRPGGANAAAQAVVTWARSQGETVLAPHARGHDQEVALQRFCERLHGIVGVMLATKIISVDGRTDLTRDAFQLVASRAAAMDEFQLDTLVRGGALSLVCFDHSSKRFLRSLYSPSAEGPRVKNVGEFRALIMNIARRITHRYVDEFRAISTDVASVVHELFSNTHDHARSDATGTAYKQSVRSLTFGLRTPSISGEQDHPADSASLRAYLASVAAASGEARTAKVFEMSVLDSGPGMAARFKRGELPDSTTIEEEARFVRRCFLPQETTRSAKSFGRGLPRVLEVLKGKGGLIHVRTGRLSLLKWFHPASGGTMNLTADDFVLPDAATGRELPNAMGRVAGTRVTILLPFGLREE